MNQLGCVYTGIFEQARVMLSDLGVEGYNEGNVVKNNNGCSGSF